MRFRRLDLTRYGKFTDFVLDFGEKPVDTPDFHIIFGPNEAGKSTTFAAMLDLLYGIERKSKYNFKHPYATMRLDAEIEFQDRVARFTRLKRDTNSLLDAQGSVLADTAILAELGGIDRAAFQTMYSLDDETLEEGGESVLASKGELGELLFSASSGLASLSQSLIELRAEGDRFFKPRVHAHELALQKKELEALKKQSDEIDVAASSFARLTESRTLARERYDTAMDALAIARTRLLAQTARLWAFPKYLSLLETRRALEPLSALPSAPSGWDEKARGLELEATRLETAERHVAADLSSIETELAELVVDETVLELADAYARLDLIRAQYLTAAKDLPVRRTRKAEVDGAIAALLRRLDQPAGTEADDLLIKPAVKGELSDLITDRAHRDKELRTAQTEYDRADLALREAEADVATSGQGYEVLADSVRQRLLTVTEAASTSDHVARLRLARNAARDAEDSLKARWLALQPWSGDGDALAGLIIPASSDVSAWHLDIHEKTAALKALVSDIERLDSGLSEIEAQLSAFAAIGGVVTDGDAQKARRDRETAWHTHQSSLNLASATTFERAMRQDDEIGAARLARVSDLARVNELSVQKAVAQQQLAERRERLAELNESLVEAKSVLATSIGTISPSLPASWSAQALSDWLTARTTALSTLETLRKVRLNVSDAQTDGDALAATLRETLSAAGTTAATDLALDLLITQARDRLDADAQLNARAGELARLVRDRDNRKKTLDMARTELEDWSTAWSKACGACWLGTDGEAPTPTTVQGLFKDLDALAGEVRTRDDLVHRISAMEADQVVYAEGIQTLARAAGLSSSLSAPEADQALAAMIAQSTAASAARLNAQSRQQTAQTEVARLTEARVEYEAQVASMCAHLEVTTLAEVIQALAVLETRQRLQDKADDSERDIVESLQASSFTEALGQLEGLDLEALRLNVEATTLHLDSEDGRVKALYAEKRSAEDAVERVDGDNTVARLEEKRRTLLLQIEEGALRWMRLKLGTSATEHALRLYREHHRSSLLNRASEAFALVSRNAYVQLRSQPEKDGEVLVAIDKEGASKKAADLSKGTRFQLYLALRVAGYHESVSHRPAIPFIADDILETFDDFRSEETLKVFARMAQSGQVIYLTHHQHLCDIARQVCPSVKIHALEDI
ncbi:ATP-binding protein [Asticcacaulis tiandongensis]|uniref:ATP-binding protein n=1 Tax=Asticcacaulis tiandongensis TaxID=2565365 RepID=UPI00112E2189|nr:AAA family ATPase [Asticcacaulis tiandongensis]